MCIRDSISSGQVLHCPYEPQKAKLVVREMTDLLVLDLVDKGLVTDQMVLTVGYDIENLTDPARRAKYHGAVEKDPYGREIPKQAHGSINLDGHTSSTRKIMCAVSELFDRIVEDVYKRQAPSRPFKEKTEVSLYPASASSQAAAPVSYTHLDVYKRQVESR